MVDWPLLAIAGGIIGWQFSRIRSLQVQLFVSHDQEEKSRGMAQETDRVWKEIGQERGWFRKDEETLDQFMERSRE